ncbi:HD domain-containing protein [Saccharibacter sp. 17.LH.SD]|uniref:HD domain-containing protein n=1 Tax=Saccharibacter sp. 17.LH.SD TaxID=2689393 RepID=UPI00136C2117|nr:HD domain-containing protein [Saccharibacter sp. 17.LH.SD]MXV44933.1 HD domain-containing protein [Saccharibacter sp. 17.LH.SD]
MLTTYDVTIPDSAFAREVTELVRDTETELLFNHSSRVYQFAVYSGRQQNLTFDEELIYAGAMFHDMGLTSRYATPHERFEVDGANAARQFMKQKGIQQTDIDKVWTAIALHTTPGIPKHMDPIIALVTEGVEMDVLGLNYAAYPESVREEIVKIFPRTPHFKEDIIQAFYEGIKHKPETTFGNVKADVLADKDPQFKRGNFCSLIRCSHWHG